MRFPISIAIVLISTGMSHAGSCGGEIARAERELRRAHPDIWLPESIAAKLHHQTTRASLEKARTEAKDDLDGALAMARQLNAEGKDSECVTTIGRFLRPLRPNFSDFWFSA